MKIRMLLAALATVAAQSAHANNTIYDCQMNSRENHGWISQRYVFDIDVADMTATVASGHFEPMGAKVKRNNSGQYKLSWGVSLKTSAGHKIRLRYNAKINPDTNAVEIRGRIVNTNAANKPVGFGSCKIHKA
ncbi:MAG: hypothetical protein AAF393_18935 [Pseudomonadota bacterium]